MLGWLFPGRRVRQSRVDACIQTTMQEAELSSTPVTLFQAAFRVQVRAQADGIFLGFDQALHRIKRCDKAGVLVQER